MDGWTQWVDLFVVCKRVDWWVDRLNLNESKDSFNPFFMMIFGMNEWMIDWMHNAQCEFISMNPNELINYKI